MAQIEEALVELQIDPVCGMKVLPEKAAGSTDHAGKTWYFCGKGCLAKFEAEPGKFDGSRAKEVAASAVKTVPVARGGYVCPMHAEVQSDKPADCSKCGMALDAADPGPTVRYTCPMHPDIVKDGPGGCPICGMALEPITVQVEAANPELENMTRRFWVGLVLTLPMLAVMVADALPGDLLAGLRGGRCAGVDGACAGDCGGVVGWLAAAAAGMGFAGSSQLEYVYADCDWVGGGLPLQRGGGGCAGSFSCCVSGYERRAGTLF